ncbi:MFS transporter [Azospirillum oleiclasticum]
MTRDPLRSLVFRLTAVTVAVMLGMAAWASWTAFQRFDPAFTPELARKAGTVGASLHAQMTRALDYGIPVDRMPGIDALFTDEMRTHGDIAYIVLTAADGRVIASAGTRIRVGDRLPTGPGPLVAGFHNTSLPLQKGAETVARLNVGIDNAYLAKASVDLMLDVVSVLVVSVLITFEVLLLVVNLAMSRVSTLRSVALRAEGGDFRCTVPAGGSRDAIDVARACRYRLDRVNQLWTDLGERLKGRTGAAVEEIRRRYAALSAGYRFREPGQPGEPAPVNLVFLRLPVFLFCLSEELSRPFLPAYAQTFASSVPWLTPDLVVSVPITLFMLVWALSQPSGARWSERWGRQRTFVAGALIGCVSLAMTAYAATMYELLLWRCLTALGYGLVLITAQGIVIDHTTSRDRASGMAMFIGGLLAAGVCGPVTGGIIADQIGFRSTFLIGAVLAAGSGLAIALLMGARAAAAPVRMAGARLSLGAAAGLARNLRFVLLMLLSAIPTKIAATAVLFCLVPLLLTQEGSTKAEVGRVQMMYFIAFILVSPLAATLSDRWQARRGFIALGGIGTLLSCVPMVYVHAWWGPPLAIALFGLSQALVGAPQLTLVSQLARDSNLSETAAIGWFRLLERLGGALGPVLAMGLSVTRSYQDAMIGISLLCGISAILFWLAFRTRPPTPVAHPQEA